MSSPDSSRPFVPPLSLRLIIKRRRFIVASTCLASALLSSVPFYFSAKAILAKLIYRYQVDAVTVIALRMLFTVPLMAAIALWQAYRHPH